MSEDEVCGEVGQLAPAVSGRGYARCLLAVAAWTPRAAPAAARRRPGCLQLDMVTSWLGFLLILVRIYYALCFNIGDLVFIFFSRCN